MKTGAYIEKSSKNKGISLIALTVTIIVIIILAGVSIAMLTQNNGVISNAKRAAITTEFSKYKEELGLFKTQELLNSRNFYDQSITAGKNVLNYNTKKDDGGNIKTVIPDLSDNYIDNFEIIKGELLFTSQDKFLLNIAKSLGIQINPYNIVDGRLLSSDNNLMLMDENGVVTIPETVTKIGEGAFSNVQGLKTIIIPYTVKEIEQNAFANNTEIEKVEFQTRTKEDGTIEGCETIGARAFYTCTNLKDITLPQSLKNLGYESFYSSGLNSVNIPGSVEIVQPGAFSSVGLTNIILNNGTKELGGNCFYGAKITNIKIPQSVTKISSLTFNNCNNLDDVDISDNSNFRYLNNNYLVEKDNNEIVYIKMNYLRSTNVLDIPNGIQTYNYQQTGRYDNIETIEIPSDLVDIPDARVFPKSITNINIDEKNNHFIVKDKMLYDINGSLIFCFSKDNIIEIPSGITKINPFSLYSVNATQVNFENDVKTLSSYIITSENKNISKIIIGSNIENINPQFIYDPLELEIEIKNNNNCVVQNKILYSKNMDILIRAYSPISNVDIPQSVKKIEEKAFERQKDIQEIIVPNSVESIGDEAFAYCTELKKIEIGKKVNAIGQNCFTASQKLSEIIINKKANSISGSPWGATQGERAIKWKQ